MIGLALLLGGVAFCIGGGLLVFSALDHRLPEFRDQQGMFAFMDRSKYSPEGQRVLTRCIGIQLFGIVAIVLSFFT
jgi:hypothetical protein